MWALAPTIFGIFIAAFLPEEVSQVEAVNNFSGLVLKAFPFFDGYVALSTFPQVTALTFSLCFIAFPFQAVWFAWIFCRFSDRDEFNRRLREKGVAFGKVFLAVVSVIFALIFSLFIYAKDPGFIGSMNTATSRLGLTIFVPGQFCLLAILLGLIFFITLEKGLPNE